MATPIARSFLRGRTAGDAVALERLETRLVLVRFKRWIAAEAILDKRCCAFKEFMEMRSAMLAGGLHRVRLRGGRNLEPHGQAVASHG